MSFRPKHLPFEEIVTFFGKLLSHIASAQPCERIKRHGWPKFSKMGWNTPEYRGRTQSSHRYGYGSSIPPLTCLGSGLDQTSTWKAVVLSCRITKGYPCISGIARISSTLFFRLPLFAPPFKDGFSDFRSNSKPICLPVYLEPAKRFSVVRQFGDRVCTIAAISQSSPS